MNLSIRVKLIAFTFCIVLLVGGSIFLYSIYQGRQRILTTVENEAREITALISDHIINDLYFLDLRSLRLELESVRSNPDIKYTYVIDPGGLVLTDGTQENLLRDQKLTDSFSQAMLRSDKWISRFEESLLKVGGPVLTPDGSRIGYFQVGFSLDAAYGLIRDTTRTALYITVICLGFGAILAVIFSTSFIRPIFAIVRASAEIGAGKLDTRLSIKRGDELGDLAESVNQMAASLQQRQAEAEQAEANRRAAEARFGEIINIAADAVIALDDSQRMVLFNKGAEQIFGYSAGEVLGQPVDLLLPPRFAGAHRQHIRAFAAGSETARRMGGRGEVSGRRRDGTEFPAEASISKLTQDGRTIFTVILRDITERRRAEEQIQRSGERARALREIDQAITSSLDLGTVLEVLLEKIDLVLPYSATTVRLFNRESGLLEPVACRNLDEEEWKAEQWRGGRGIPNVVFETKAPVTISNVQSDPQNRDQGFFRKHGLVSYMGVPLIAKGEILGVISFYTKEEHEFNKEEIEFLSTLAGQAAIAIQNSQLYEETKRQAVKLENANKVKDEFLSVMSHELRTPLNVVMGYTGMIRDGILGEINPEQEKALEKVISRARDQLTMITSILQAVQLEAGELVVEEQAIGLGDLLNELKLHYDIPSGKEITLIWDYPVDLPMINSDGDKLKHILKNLINNAIKFTSKGSVTISAGPVEKRGGADGQGARGDSPQRPSSSAPMLSFVEFKVTDTGVGIPEEALPVIFERFRQVDSSETRSYGGVGIGLYIVKRFTEMLGGKVEVESEVGKGSTFTVTIPTNGIGQEAESSRGEAAIHIQ